MERINPLKLHDENLVLGGFFLKSFLFCRDRGQNEIHNLILDVWNELTKLIDGQKIDPWIDSQWYFDEVSSRIKDILIIIIIMLTIIIIIYFILLRS
ncbi:unnamed protein product [Trichobilharzia regenti]|nr:unnamed protein product [Trichobilharzia regenti]